VIIAKVTYRCDICLGDFRPAAEYQYDDGVPMDSAPTDAARSFIAWTRHICARCAKLMAPRDVEKHPEVVASREAALDRLKFHEPKHGYGKPMFGDKT